MAVTQNTYTGNGSTVLFSFTFPYLQQADVKVNINDQPTTAYTFANATTIQFDTAPANGDSIRIYRDTEDSSPTATFYPGSAIRSQDLNNNFLQVLYRTQETSNYSVQDAGNFTFTGQYTFTNPVTIPTPSLNFHATTKEYVDQLAFSSTGITDGTKGDIVLSSNGTVWTVGNGTITPAKLSQAYLTSSEANSTYLTQSSAASTYQTQSGMSSYLARSGGTMTGNITFTNGQTYPKVPVNPQTQAYTLAADDAGKVVSITTGGVTIPANVFVSGDIISIYNNSNSSQTITQGSSVTLRQAASANTGNRTLAQYGVCTVLCVSSNTFVISGAGLT